MKINDLALRILIGFLAAMVTDLQAYKAARSSDPKATFDILLALKRWAVGLFLGGGVSLLGS